MPKSSVPKRCFVPACNNTSANSSKIFLTVPFKEAIRKQWCIAVKRNKIPKATSGGFFCCEDHFNLEDDCENWMHYKLMQQTLTLKQGVVPHKNLSGEDVSKEYSQLSDSAKKRKLQNIQHASAEVAKKLEFCEPSTSAQMPSPEKMDFCSSSSSSKLSSVQSSTSSEGKFLSETSSDEELKKNHLQKISLERTLLIIENHSRFYLGLPKDTYFIVKLLEVEAKVSVRNILIILKKIRLNDAFYRLGLDFGIATSTVSKIFSNDLITLASFFKNLIYWPTPRCIKEQLPIPFRARYYNVQSIIDCFEVEIEQPTNSLHQSLTWSEYKKCNTLKYLLSATPDGIVNFVSEGFGGRVTDSEIVTQSAYLNVLPENCDVMADRGFKQIDAALAVKKCKLIRPPSVASGSKSSKEDVKKSKRIASLRIHIERVIRRLREFEMLKPHACVDRNMVWKLDYVVYIACGVINLQGPLIK